MCKQKKMRKVTIIFSMWLICVAIASHNNSSGIEKPKMDFTDSVLQILKKNGKKYLTFASMDIEEFDIKEKIQIRSYCDEKIWNMGRLLENFDWAFLVAIPTQDRMKAFHDKLFEMFESSFPLKTKIIHKENEPFMTDALIKMKRKKNREYNKHRQSYKYLELKRIYKEMLSKAKKKFYRRNIRNGK